MLQQIIATLHRVVNQIVGVGIGPFARRDNPPIYDFFLFALAAALVLGIANFIVIRARHRRNRRSIGTVLIGEISILAQQLIFIGCVWLAYATPVNRLFWTPPGAGTFWAGLYGVAAYTVHGLLAIIGIYLLAIAWLIQFNVPFRNLHVIAFALLCGLIIPTAGWEIQRWPLGFVIPIELTVAPLAAFFMVTLFVGREAEQVNLRRLETTVYTLLLALGVAFVWLEHGIDMRYTNIYATFILISIFLGQIVKQDNFIRLQTILYVLVLIAGIVLIWLNGPLDPYFISTYGIFYIFIILDDLVACFIAVFMPDDPRHLYLFLSPLRWTFTVPGVLLLAGIAAAGYFSSIIANPEVSYTIWVEAGAAAAAYMLFKPLTDEARGKLASSQAAETWTGALSDGRRQLQRGRSRELKEPGGVIVDADPPRSPKSGSDGDQQGLQRPLGDHQVAAQEAQEAIGEAGDAALRLFNGLDYPAFIIFLAVTYGSHYLFANLDLSRQVNSAAVSIGFGAAALVANIVTLLIDNRLFRGTAYTSIQLLLITIPVTLLAGILTLIPLANAPLAISGVSPSILLADTHYRLATLHTLVQGFLILLTVGQVTYLFQVIRRAQEQPI